MSHRIKGLPVDPRQHNYMKKLLQITAERNGQLPVPRGSGVTDCFVSHDNWCRALKGGICNCDPDVVFKSR